jgi:hypothetical protein
MKVQYGCGICAPQGWLNFDSSPTIVIQRLPILGVFFRCAASPKFPRNVRSGNIAKGLPVPDESADCAYCSHVLEHLSLKDFRSALANTYRMLKTGGTFRFVLPDLEHYIGQYAHNVTDRRAMQFMEDTLLGVQQRQTGIIGFTREWLGGSKHLWMWDYEGIRAELISAGFRDIRRAQFGDSTVSGFQEVESADRWRDCLGVEVKK